MAVASPPPSSSPWIQGPVADVLLGTGMLYLPFFVVSLFIGPQILIGSLSVMPFLILVFANAHLGATLVRVYGRAEDRNAYRLFAVWITLLIAGLFLIGLWVPLVGSLLLTFYLTVVPWHFTGQNYGISLVFLRRRGVEITAGLKRHLWSSFFLSYVLWILALHSSQPGTVDYAPLRLQGGVYSFLPIGIPATALPYLLSIVGVLYTWSIVEVGLRLYGRAPLRLLLPTLLLMLSQLLWFSAPVIGRFFFDAQQLGPLAALWSPFNAGSTFLVVSLMHSLQYLWITDYYVRKEQPGVSRPGFLWMALLAGMAIFGIPFLLLQPNIGGGPSYEMGLLLMLNGALNVHHVMLDGAIWKLRNTRIASILIRGHGETRGQGDTGPVIAVPQRAWLRRAIWASGLLGVVLVFGAQIERQLGLTPAVDADDPARLEASLTRLSWLGQDHSAARYRLGQLKRKAGDDEGALQEFQRSNEIMPSSESWFGIAIVHESRGHLRQAVNAYEQAVRLAPNDVATLVAAGRASMKAGRPERAEQLLSHAAELDPENGDLRLVLNAIQKRPATAPKL